jgi:DNA-binding transcriptional MocR family regulator
MYSARGRYRNCLRLSCCYPWNEAYERALVRVGELASGMGKLGKTAW